MGKLSDADNVDNPRKPAPKDIPGVVSGYFQDILEAEADTSSPALQSENDTKEHSQSTNTKVIKRSSRQNVQAICSLPSQLIGRQILTTMYQVANSSDVETSIKTLSFWNCLFQLHVPEYLAFSPHNIAKDSPNAKQVQELQGLFDSGKLTQELVLANISKPSQEALESLKHCLDNTGCLKLLLGMLSDSKMAAVRVCFILQILQGLFVAAGVSTGDGSRQAKEKERQSQDIAKKHSNTSGYEASSSKDNDDQFRASDEGAWEDKNCPALSSDSCLDKNKTDLCQIVGTGKTDDSFEEVFTNFLRLDFVLIGQVICARELDTLDSVLDDLIEPDEEWGLPGDINVDCY